MLQQIIRCDRCGQTVTGNFNGTVPTGWLSLEHKDLCIVCKATRENILAEQKLQMDKFWRCI